MKKKIEYLTFDECLVKYARFYIGLDHIIHKLRAARSYEICFKSGNKLISLNGEPYVDSNDQA